MASFFRRLSATVLLGGSVLLVSLAISGCSDDDKGGGCAGVLRDGVCIAKCVESRDCAGNQVCSPVVAEEGLCYGACTVASADNPDQDCGPGEACVDGTNMAGAAIKLCRSRGDVGLVPNGYGVACTSGNECDEAHGLVCYAGRCGLPVGTACTAPTQCSTAVCDAGACAQPCTGLAGCPAGTACDGLKGDGTAGVCRPAPQLAAGQYSQPCPKGDECDAAAGFQCIGFAGDLDAFCTKPNGCEADADCPQGYWCGGVRTGEAEEGKIPPSERACLKRTFCAPCDTDLDCGFTFGAKCVPDAEGNKFCSTSCDPDLRSCRFGAECVDVGGGDFACRPDIGSCAQAAAPVSCGSCRNDLDCGPGGFCLGDTIQGAINKPSVRWCVTPCGAPDANGKATCPKAANGLEMVCLDANNLDLSTRDLGVPTGSGATATVPVLPNYCFPAPTFDNEKSYENDPPKGVCGNGLRDPGEECDDANKSATDGCDECKITEKCRFSTPLESSDETPSLKAADGSVVETIPGSCKSFLVEGSLEAAGDIDVVDYDMGTNLTTALAELFTGDLDTCDTDLMLEIRDGQKPDVTVACEDLAPPTLRFASLLDCGKDIGCGSCEADTGKCGLCDDDSGLGDCPRVLFDRVTGYNGAKVINASSHKWMRIRARGAAATVPAYKLVVTGQKSDASSPGSLVNGPQLTCW
jgi:hypothetical protein